ncbi:hypothetical protein NE237_018609 [Protea cynaroides]|uniref:Uncharacterized protein n=1 Tax=Protea cynaroides TaxID=273540 RepID=A0A9Q0QP34_9MAGN|nr:hypothetical protein NE237_018609 [Protea cynaroides]
MKIWQEKISYGLVKLDTVKTTLHTWRLGSGGSSLDASIDPAQVTPVVTESGKEIIELGFVLASVGTGLHMGGDGEGKGGIPIRDDGAARGREDRAPTAEIVNHGVEFGATLIAFLDDEAMGHTDYKIHMSSNIEPVRF